MIDLLEGEFHAAAVIQLIDGPNTWRQLAVYEIAAGRIVSIVLYEDEPHP